MRKILGLDLGTTSIGWALVNEASKENEISSIEALGVRVIPLTTDEQNNFEAGRTITTNAERTQKRGARRTLQRYKLRRKMLIRMLKETGVITSKTQFAEEGRGSTHSLLKLRAKAASEKIHLEDFGRILLSLNKKRGYKSNRKANSEEEGEIVDSMGIAKELQRKGWTPGKYVYNRIQEGKFSIPDFYRSDLIEEFDRIWKRQQQSHPDVFLDLHKHELDGKNKNDTANYFQRKMGITRAEFKGKRNEKTEQLYLWRAKAVDEAIEPSITAEVLVEINNQINSASGYLGEIGDRSKILAFENYTVGQYLYKQIKENTNNRLKNQVFYRQDYEDEFDKIWDIQAQYYPQLSDELKEKIKKEIIFYQRPLRSQKNLISLCEFESEEIEITIDGKKKKQKIGPRVAPKTSPIFQEFKVWQVLNNLEISVDGDSARRLTEEEKVELYDALCLSEKLSKTEVGSILGHKRGIVELKNYEDLSGNITAAKLFEGFNKVVQLSGHDAVNIKKMNAEKVISAFEEIFKVLGIDTRILRFDPLLNAKELIKQPYYELWHLLYSYVGDNSRTGTEALVQKLKEKFGFDDEGAKVLSSIKFDNDYGRLSAKAMKKIIPFLKEGYEYSKASEKAGYNHSGSLTKEEQNNRVLKEKLDPIMKNSLRNPVVEKILNQMVNVINAIIDEYGKPDEVRVELARELKKSASERESMTKAINKAKREHELYREKIKNEFGLPYVSRNDLIKYKLYLELAENGYRTLYTDQKIEPRKLFSKEIDIEHIIPKAKLYDDSFSNKTLEYRNANLEKGDMTAFDYVAGKGSEKLQQYEARINSLRSLSPRKKKLLLMSEENIPKDFLERDLRNSQYIAKKALSMLQEVFRSVLSSTGKVTQKLREDWQLVDVLKELNWSKYDKLGMTYYVENKEGKKLKRIKDWTKRNDHRHHAMDALAVAFTTVSHIQYLNNESALSKKGKSIKGIRDKIMSRDDYGKMRFKPPMPVEEMRAQAKNHLERILVSFKAKNKVTTPNTNRIKTSNGTIEKFQNTPRGQLHKETIYGTTKQYVTKDNVRVNGAFDEESISKVAKKNYREALLRRLSEFGGDPKKAFTGKNSLSKNPVYIDELQMSKVPDKVKLVWQDTIYTIRKEVGPDLKVDKVIDPKSREILERRLAKFNGDTKKAFSNLEDDPIWYDEKNGIKIKRVKITGVTNAVPIHKKRDHLGQDILDENGQAMDAAYVSPGNNHHVAIYKDEDGNLYEEVVSFFEAVERKNQRVPVINSHFENGAPLLFTMKQNEYFVFPNEDEGFNPAEIDLFDPSQYQEISKNLFRVQKISSLTYGNSVIREFAFRHHLETQLNNDKRLKGKTWILIKSLEPLNSIVKVRLNHLGKIVHVGEY